MQPQLWSLNSLSVELGVDRRTLARKLGGLDPDETVRQGRRISRRYLLARVIDHLHGGYDLDPAQERARRDKESADRIAMQNAERREQLVPAGDIEAAWTHIALVIRSHLLNGPSTLGPQLLHQTDANVVAEAIRTWLYNALEHLAEWTPPTQPEGDAN